MSKKNPMIDRPSHYQGDSMQAIDVIEAFGLNFNMGNVLKYALRAGKKHDKQEDLDKAIWYLMREMESSKPKK